MMDSITLDGFFASLMAAESVLGCRAILHGPGACRMHTSHLSSNEAMRPYKTIEGPFFFGDHRVPCTYVDEEDYINGADYKVTELLNLIDDAELCVIVSSPGTSLIGDDLNGAATRSSFKGKTVIPEYCHMSEPAHRGYDSTMADMVSTVCKRSKRDEGVVNIIGLPILLEGWKETVEELRSYLKAMGLRVGAFVGAGCTVDELKKSSRAGLNVAILPEFCVDTAESYRRIGVPTIYPGAPLGFDATSEWVKSVAKATGKDPSKALAMIDGVRKYASNLLTSSLMYGMIARGATFSVKLENSLALPLAKWLHEYLAMFPVCIESRKWWDEEYREEMERFLDGIGCGDALGRKIGETRADAAFADGNTVGILEKRGTCSVGINMCRPSRVRLRFRERPVLGTGGAMRLLDDLFNDMTPR